ncbi:MAG TPA: GtrA family protein [Anaerolineales bacterium]|nr:GtrA family protein [Anaerolineales bacterium]
MTRVSVLANPRERTRFLRFAFVGIVGAVVDFGTFNLLIAFTRLTPVWASIFSFIAAILSNFTWNRYWTYPDSRTKPVGQQMVQFTVVSVVGLLIRTPIIAILEPVFQRLFGLLSFLPAGFITAEFLAGNLALAVAVIVVMFWNFFVNRYWTYSDIE